MRAIILAPALVVAWGMGAIARPLDVFPFHLSVNAFVDQVAGYPGVAPADRRPDEGYQRSYAQGYQAGVVDATQGRLWCATPGMKPSEVDDRIWAAMKSRAGTMPRTSAADELVRLYVARFPCHAGS